MICRNGIVLVLLLHSVAAAEVVSIRSVERILVGASPLDTFRRPCGMVADVKHQVLVIADTGNHRVVFFDAGGRSRGALRWDAATPDDRIGEPRCVALGARGRLYVVDGLTNTVEVLTTTGSHLAFLRPTRSTETDAATPVQFVAVGASGRLYALSSRPQPGVAVIASNGATESTFGFADPGVGALVAPAALAVNEDETRLAIADPEARLQVKIVSITGDVLSSFGPHGEGDGTFSMASHVAWGPHGTLWVTDTIRHSISVFDAQGGFLGRLGGYGTGPGQFNYPVACAFLAEDRVVVLERAGARCQILAFDLQLPGLREARAPHPVSGVDDAGTLTTGGR